MVDDSIGCYIAIVSSKRPQNVAGMEAFLGVQPTWYVGLGEGELYRQAGARNVIEAGGLVETRNRAIDDAFGLGVPAVEVSDDLRWLKRSVSKRNSERHELPFADCVKLMIEAAQGYGLRLAGISPTNNAFYSDPEKPVKTRVFICADLFVLLPPCDLRFDDSLRLKEDYDYTLQHIAAYGGVVRRDDIQAQFLHRTNPGGAVAYRTARAEQEAIDYLKAKWGTLVADNPRRENEILLRC